MKTFSCCKSSVILIVVMFFAGTLFSQNCASFIPQKIGAKMEMKHYDAMNKLESTSSTIIKSKTNTPLGYNITVVVNTHDEKKGKDISNPLTFKCEKGVFTWDLNDMVKGAFPKDKVEGLDVKISGTAIKFPAKLYTGQKLDDANVTTTVIKGGMTMFNITVNFINRKVVSMEKITTLAGTYSCYKISYDIESKGMGATTIHKIDWMAEGMGIVRSETYDQKNKLQGYSVLSAYSE